MAVDKRLERWVAQDGTIRTERLFDFEVWKGKKQVHLYVAFNLKPEVAEHIVHLHNASLTKLN